MSYPSPASWRSGLEQWQVLNALFEGFRERDMPLVTGLDEETVARHLARIHADLAAIHDLLWWMATGECGEFLPPLTSREDSELPDLVDAFEALPEEGRVSVIRLLLRRDREFARRMMDQLVRLGIPEAVELAQAASAPPGSVGATAG